MLMTMLSIAVMHCGAERWNVKTLADGFDPPAPAQVTTVTQLSKLPMPKWNDNAPRMEAERRLVQVDAKIIGYKVEADEDFHVVIQDVDSSSPVTMVVEFPSSHCTKDARLAAARADFLALAPKKPAAEYKKVAIPIPVRLTGVPFFDKHLPGHIPTGSAPNGVELHPVMSVRPMM